MKTSTVLLIAILTLSAFVPALTQVTNLTVNSSLTSFTMVSGDVVD